MYSQSCVVVLVCLCVFYVLVCYVLFMYWFVMFLFMYLCIGLLCCVVIYLFVLSHHATSTHVLHSQPHASRWTALSPASTWRSLGPSALCADAKWR